MQLLCCCALLRACLTALFLVWSLGSPLSFNRHHQLDFLSMQLLADRPRHKPAGVNSREGKLA